MKQIAETINCWAANLGTDRRTLERQLTKSGYVLKPAKKAGQSGGEKISAKAIDTARVGEITEAAIRLKNAQAADQERKNREADGEVVQMQQVEAMLTELVVTPLRQALTSAPTTIDVNCNPTDPELARKAIQNWVDETLKLLRDKLPINDATAIQ